MKNLFLKTFSMKATGLLAVLLFMSVLSYGQDKHFFLKIIEKNGAGWLQLSEFSGDAASATINPITAVPGQLDFGYQPLNGAPNFQLIHLIKDHEENFIQCRMGLFRDGSGAPSRHGWTIKFQIVSISDPDNTETPVTPVYDASALDYYDDGKILFVIDPSDSLANIYKTNNERYKEFVLTHIRH